MKKKVILIIIIFLIVFAIFLYNKMMASQIPVSIDGKTAKDQLLFSGLGVFNDKYTGNLKTTEIMKKIEKVTKKELPTLHKEIKKSNDKNLEEYYVKNAEKIKKNFGYENSGDFKKFAKKIQKISYNLDSWYKIEINKESFNNTYNEDYSYVEYDVIYKNFEKENTITFILMISRNSNVKTNYIIDIKE